MYSKIMVPVDLTHADRLTKSLEVAAKLAQTFEAEIVYVGVTSALPGSIAHTPDEYRAKLEAFAKEQGEANGLTASGHMMVGHDVAVEIDHELLKAVDETGADLVVMASHIPNITDYVWPSNGGRIAGHAKCSVMIVRSSGE